MTPPPPLDLEYPVTLLCGTALLIASGPWPTWWIRGTGMALVALATVGPNIVAWAAQGKEDPDAP